MRLHHIGIVVPDIKAASPWWEQTCRFHKISDIISDPIQDVRVQFFRADDGFCVELIEPSSESSPVFRFLNKQGGGLYHQCFEVQDLDTILAEWREAGAFLVKKPEPATAFNERRIAFIMTPQRLLVELLEANSSKP